MNFACHQLHCDGAGNGIHKVSAGHTAHCIEQFQAALPLDLHADTSYRSTIFSNFWPLTVLISACPDLAPNLLIPESGSIYGPVYKHKVPCMFVPKMDDRLTLNVS